MSYGEYKPPAALAPIVACTWEQEAGNGRTQRVVPDGCVDLIWIAERRLVIAGPDTRPRLEPLAAGSRVTGIRLRPGAAGGVLRVPAASLRDGSVPVEHVLGDGGRRIEEELANGADPRTALIRAVAARAVPPDPLIAAAAAALERPDARVGDLADDLAISERQLRRRFDLAVGYGPKTLARVLRFQRLRRLAPAPLARLALDAGYADQAHMTAEVTRLAGLPPVRFLKDDGASPA